MAMTKTSKQVPTFREWNPLAERFHGVRRVEPPSELAENRAVGPDKVPKSEPMAN